MKRRLQVLWITALVVALLGTAGPTPEQKTAQLGSDVTEFFVSAVGSTDAESAISIGVANEVLKQHNCWEQTDKATDEQANCITNSGHALGSIPRLFVTPENGWTAEEMATNCATHPNAIGGVVITYYYGNGTHFFLLWQAEATYLHLFAEVIACNGAWASPSPNPKAATPSDSARATPTYTVQPQVVDAILELPGSADAKAGEPTAWVVHHTQVSVPLLTLGAVGALLAKTYSPGNASKAGTTNTITSSVIVGSVLNQASSRDIPGFSIPVRLRHEAQRVGDDLIRAIQADCTAQPPLQPPTTSFQGICAELNFVPQEVH